MDQDDVNETGISMVELLEQEEELENDAEAVLGAGDDSICTYDQGYMKRQPLYACLTCCPSLGNNKAACCLACSYNCHEGHELIELYTKRHFKCDCGNSKFSSSNPCRLNKDKAGVNSDNTYNQNFEGKYCTCSRPYPDPEDQVEDSMIQCIVCEDWYHGRHLKVDVLPADESYSEMMCPACVVKLPFLEHYLGFTVNTDKTEEEADVDIIGTPKAQECNTSSAEVNAVQGSSEGSCKLTKLPKRPIGSRALFLVQDWRSQLCCCHSCTKMYGDLKVGYLTDVQDTVAFYESQGRAKRLRSRDSAEREMEALSSLDRVTRTEVVQEYNNLSTSLREYLRKFAENGKVVKDEDIKEFFSQLTANKKQRSNGMQYFCK